MAFILAMGINRQVQQKAQTELDLVVGKDRLPAREDIQSLPYIQAVKMETMRLYPVVPLAPPHASMEDDEYNGYFIPAGSTVIGVRGQSSYACLHRSRYPFCDLSVERVVGQRIAHFVSHVDIVSGPSCAIQSLTPVIPTPFGRSDSSWTGT